MSTMARQLVGESYVKRLARIGLHGSDMQRLTAKVEAANGRRRSRIVGGEEIRKFVELALENPGKAVTVYSFDGFVPNSYSYRAPITVLVRPEGESGLAKAFARVVDAKRTGGRGSLMVVGGQGGKSDAEIERDLRRGFVVNDAPMAIVRLKKSDPKRFNRFLKYAMAYLRGNAESNPRS